VKWAQLFGPRLPQKVPHSNAQNIIAINNLAIKVGNRNTFIHNNFGGST